jgi:hypothetical protein
LKLNPGWKVAPKKFELFDSTDSLPGKVPSKILVLVLEAPELAELHKELIGMGGTHDFPDYTPHVTLNYSFSSVYDVEALPVPSFELEVERVISEPLNLDWNS